MTSNRLHLTLHDPLEQGASFRERFEEALAIVLELGRTDPGDPQHLGDGSRPRARHLQQGGVRKNHVWRYAAFTGDLLAKRA